MSISSIPLQSSGVTSLSWANFFIQRTYAATLSLLGISKNIFSAIFGGMKGMSIHSPLIPLLSPSRYVL